MGGGGDDADVFKGFWFDYFCVCFHDEVVCWRQALNEMPRQIRIQLMKS